MPNAPATSRRHAPARACAALLLALAASPIGPVAAANLPAPPAPRSSRFT